MNRILSVFCAVGFGYFAVKAKTMREECNSLQAAYDTLEMDFDEQTADFKEMKDSANKALYISAYLSMLLAKNGIELSEFDKQVLSDPPGLVGEEIPTLFEQVHEDPSVLEFLIDDFPTEETL